MNNSRLRWLVILNRELERMHQLLRTNSHESGVSEVNEETKKWARDEITKLHGMIAPLVMIGPELVEDPEIRIF
jgi:hypothetical protein